MVYYCSAYGCKNKQKKGCGLTFHRFPKTPDLRKKWAAATKREGFTPSEFSRLCSNHFSEESYQIRPNASYRLLKDDAVPTIFDFPAHLLAPPPKKRRIIVKHEEPEKSPQTGTATVSSGGFLQAMDLEIQESLKPSNAKPKSPKKRKSPRKVGRPKRELSPTKKYLLHKIKTLQQRLKRREKKISTTKDLLNVLERQLKAPNSLVDVLKDNFSGFPLELVMNVYENQGRRKVKQKFSEKMKEFALTIHFYSPKAYYSLRKMNLCLPHPRTLRKWISGFNCSPGFLQEVFNYLRVNAPVEKTFLQDVSLVFDSMSIRKQIIYDHGLGKNIGYADLGSCFRVGKEETVATEALVFQILTLRNHFKCVIAYFFVDKIDSRVLSQLIKTAILKLVDVGIRVQNVTCEGASSNISALGKLGCSFPDKPFFHITGLSYPVCAILDACHALKLCRNVAADKRVMKSADGEINFKYIEKLHDFQKREGLRLRNKLSENHILFRNRKMNVRIAAQTLSSSVADALDFLCSRKHPDFQGCEPTIKFIRLIDRIFDHMNSRDPFGKGSKAPVTLANKASDDAFLSEVQIYFSQLTVEGIPIFKHARKTFAIGFLGGLKAIQMLRDRLLVTSDFNYLLTYKFSQDHLQLFFSCIRSRSGHNDNPNVIQFQCALRKLMFRNSVTGSEVSNCYEFDPIQQFVFETGDVLLAESEENENEDISLPIEEVQTSYYKDNILHYICGFAVRRLDKKLNCQDCSNVLLTSESDLTASTHFTDFLSKGCLIRPSQDVLKLAKFLYHLILSEKPERLNTKRILVTACNHFNETLFKGHPSNNEHVLKLIKLVGELLIKTICFHEAKKQTDTATTSSKVGLRQKLNKIILFSSV